MTPALEIGIGALAAVGFTYLAQALVRRRALMIYALALIAAALIYFLAALSGGYKNILSETVGLGIFSALAIFALRRSAILLALGWMLHVGWDLAAYPLISAASMPHGYRWACVGFDLVLAGYLVGRFGAKKA